jgi:aminotransferase
MDFRRRLPEIRWQFCLSPVPPACPRPGACPARPDRLDQKSSRFSYGGPAAAPLQQAGVLALGLPDAYYVQLSQEYAARRDHLVTTLQSTGFKRFIPRGAYYVMTDISTFGFADDVSFVRHLVANIGVAAVPGSSFLFNVSGGSQNARFYFCKKYETLEMARHQLFRLN